MVRVGVRRWHRGRQHRQQLSRRGQREHSGESRTTFTSRISAAACGAAAASVAFLELQTPLSYASSLPSQRHAP
eukprot:2767193-Pleurochrysis_carterae.AAC.1